MPARVPGPLVCVDVRMSCPEVAACESVYPALVHAHTCCACKLTAHSLIVLNVVIINTKPNNDVFTFGVWKNQKRTLQMPIARV